MRLLRQLVQWKADEMTFFEWDDRYDIGVPDMNREHQRLIALMNQLHVHHESHAPRELLAKTVAALFDYTKTHFAHEEAYMAKIRYPELRVHQLVHRELLERLTEHKQSFEQTGVLSPTFFSFLKRWLAAHILGIDKKYAS